MNLRLNKDETIRRNQLFSGLKSYYPLIAHEKICNNVKIYTNDFLQNLLLCAEFQNNPLDYSDQQFKKTFIHLQSDYNFLAQEIERQQQQYMRLMMQQQQRLQQQGYYNSQYQQPQYQNYNESYGQGNQYYQQGNNYQQPNYQQPNYQQYNYQQPNYQQQNYQQQNYQQQNYQQQNYQQQSYQQQSYQQQSYQQQSYQQQNYQQYTNYQESDQRRNKSYVEKNSQPTYQSYDYSVQPEDYVAPSSSQEQTIKEEKLQPFMEEETKQQQATEPIIEEPQPPKPPKPSKFSLQQIKSFIENFSKENKKNVTPSIIQQVELLNSWETKIETITLKETQPRQRNNNKGGKNNDKNFNKGGNYKPSTQDIVSLGNLKKKEDVFTISLGNRQSVQTRVLKQKFRKQAQVDFEQMMEQKVKNANEVDKAKRQIVFNLNLLAPENLKDIEGDLKSYLYDNKDICKVLIQQIIQKAWVQPKYSSTYAKLCSDFAKKDASRFKFKHQAQQGDQQQKEQKEQKADKKKANPFKSLLIQEVQQTFIRQQQNHVFKDNAQKDNYLKTKKKKILGNVKFIAQLIKIKVLNKKIAKLCISELLYDFLANYNWSKSNPNEFKYSFYDYYMEAVIEFIQILSQKFEQLDDPKGVYADYTKVLQYVTSLINGQKSPEGALEELSQVKADDYFKLFLFIDSQILTKTNNRLSSLLKNLQERRDKKWQRHHAQSQGPKKLEDIKNQIAREQQQVSSTVVTEKKSKKQLQKLDEEMKSLLTNVQEGETYNKQYENIVKTHGNEDIIMSYLKLVAQAKKDQVAKRVDLFDFMLEKKDVNIEVFKKQWPKAISTLAFLSSDLPFCGAAMAKLLIKIDEKRGIRMSDFYVKFDVEEQEDEKYFMDEVFNKWFFYTKKEEIKQFVEVSQSCSGMI